MTKLKMMRTIASVVTGLTFAAGVGVAGAHPALHNGSSTNNSTHSTVSNTVGVDNDNVQNAISGTATVTGGSNSKNKGWDNKGGNKSSGGGTALSGDATNDNTTSLGVTIANSNTCGCGTQGVSSDSQSGDHKDKNGNVDNSVTTKVTNEVSVDNDNVQNATSGDASVTGGGSKSNSSSATSGDASNTNNTTVTVGITN